MFNTLGNLTVNPRAGLLFVDFAAGATLQLYGHAHIAGERERTIELEVTAVTEASF